MRGTAYQPPLKMPPLHDKQAWSQYHMAIDRARRGQPDLTDLLTAMRTAAVACSFQQHTHAEGDRPPTALGDMLHALWHATHETHRWGYFLRTKPSDEDYFFERRKFFNCSNAIGVAVLLQTF